jgi:hypothetical protein
MPLRSASDFPPSPAPEALEGGLQRSHPGHGLARNHQPGHGRIDPGLQAIDHALLFRHEGGGWLRLNRMFFGELAGVLRQLQRQVWVA